MNNIKPRTEHQKSIDYQKSRVYKWEREVCPRFDKSLVPFEQAQAIVDYIWADMGLEFPPKVKEMPKQNRNYAGKANRNVVILDGAQPTFVIVHELAHSMTLHRELGIDSRHGPKFVGMYMKLLERYCNVPLPVLMYTAAEVHDVDYDLSVKPVFLDAA